jgi:hypothetical protein
MDYNFLTKEPTLIVIVSGEFVAERLSSVYSAEAKYCG